MAACLIGSFLTAFAPVGMLTAEASGIVKTSTTIISALNPSKAGVKVTFTSFVTVPRGLPSGQSGPSGTVTFSAGTTTLGTATLSSTGTAKISTSSLRAGTVSVKASYHGDAVYAASNASLDEAVAASTPAATRTALGFSPNPVETGQPESLTARVSAQHGGTGTPSGDVVFKSGSSNLGTKPLDGAGVATLRVSDLPAGDGLITATYKGTRSFASSGTDGKLDVTAVPVASTVAVSSKENPAVSGHPVTLEARVTSGGVAALGSVRFFSDGTSLGTVALQSGMASFTTSSLAVGDHVITAQYSGSSGSGSAESDIVETITSTKAPTDVVVDSSFTPAYAGDSVSYSASVSPADGVGTPTGTVTFSATGPSGTTGLGSAQLSGGVATISSSALEPGTYKITASYGGDGADLASSGQSMQQVTATLLPSTLNLSASADPSVAGGSVTFTTSVQPASYSGPVPSGSVTFSNGSTRLATVALSRGRASYRASFSKAGTEEITARYAGSAPYAASSAALSEVVGSGSLPVWVSSFTVNPDPAVTGQPAMLDVDLQDGSNATITGGSITFLSGGTRVASAPVTAGHAEAAVTFASSGIRGLEAVYSGSSTFSATSASVEEYVQSTSLTTETVVASSRNPIVSGDPVTLVAQVESNTFDGSPVGTVTFRSGSTTLGTKTVNGGFASLTTRSLASGSDDVTASFTGTSGYSSSSSGNYLEVVGTTPIATTTLLSAAPAPAVNGQTVTLSADVTPTDGEGGNPSGTVTFSTGSTTIGTAALRGGMASITTSSLPQGSDPLTATYNGDQFYEGSNTSTTEEVTSSKDSLPLTFDASADPTVARQPLSLVATLPAGDATGNVTFTNGSTDLGTAVVIQGSATLQLSSPLPDGTDLLGASYSGSNLYEPASAVLTEVVAANRLPTSQALSPSANPVDAGQLVTLTDAVTTSSSGSAPPAGTVTFKEGSNLLATVPLSDSTATYETASLATGNNAITATYSGDGSSAPSAMTTDVLVLSRTSSSATGISLSLGQDPVEVDRPVLVTTTVSALNSGEQPVGTVTLTDSNPVGSVLLGVAAVQPGSGTATFTVVLPTAGSNVLTADFSGGSGFLPSQASSIETVSTTEQESQLSVTSSADPSETDQPVTFIAEVSPAKPDSGDVAPTGAVTFATGSTVLGTSDVVAGKASITTSGLAAGDDVVTAAYAGDANYASSESSLGQQVSSTALVSSVVLQASPRALVAGHADTLSASVAAFDGTPLHTGTVTFAVGTTTIGTADVVDGAAVLATLALPTGTDNVSATYSGDADYGSSSATAQVTVQTAKFASSLHFFPTAPTVAGQPVTIDATVSGPVGATDPTGSVSFKIGSTHLGSSDVSGGSARLTTTALPAGTDAVTATYTGNGTFTSTSSTMSVTVRSTRFGSATEVWPSADAVTKGQQVTLIAQVGATSVAAVEPTGTVTFLDGSKTVGTAEITAGEAAVTTSLPVGTAAITASYGGDGSFAPSSGKTSVAVSATAFKTTTVVSSNEEPSRAREPVTITATVSGPNGTEPPGGSVVFKSGTSLLGTAELFPSDDVGGAPANGEGAHDASPGGYSVATLTTSALPVGTDLVTAAYGGKPSYLASSGTYRQSVQSGLLAPIVRMNPSTELAASYEPVTFNVTVLAPAGDGVVPSGTVTFSATNGSTTEKLGTATLDEQGEVDASITVTSLPTGTDTVTAAYSGDASYAAASTRVTETVYPLLTTGILMTASPSYAYTGQPVTFTAIVTTHTVALPTGTVVFSVGSTTIGTAPLQYGVAVLTTAALPTGTDTVTASYEPGPFFRNSSQQISVTVSSTTLPTSTSVDGTSPTIEGERDTFYVSVAGEKGGESTPTGTVTLSTGSSRLGTETLRAGRAAFTVSDLPAGADTVTATYSGDHDFATSVGSQPVTVNEGAYWITQSTGVVTPEGSAKSYKLAPGSPAASSPVVAMTPSFNGAGYYLLTASGRISAYGDATPPSGSCPTATDYAALAVNPLDKGLWTVQQNGRVCARGGSEPLGPKSGTTLRGKVVAVSSTDDGKGIYLVTNTGRVYPYGDAIDSFYGGLPSGTATNIVGMAMYDYGKGYWLVGQGGSVYRFGRAPKLGSTTGRLPGPIVDIAATQDSDGYYLVTDTGRLYLFGDAYRYGDLSSNGVKNVIGVAVPHSGGF